MKEDVWILLLLEGQVKAIEIAGICCGFKSQNCNYCLGDLGCKVQYEVPISSMLKE